MLAQRSAFSSTPMFSSPTAGSVFAEPRQLDRAGEARRPRADEQHVQLHLVAGALGPFLEDEAVEGQRWLVLRRGSR